MEILKLQSQIRTEAGKSFARKMRTEGRIPAILYGRKTEPLSLELDEMAIRAAVSQRPESAIIDLMVEGGGSDEPINVIIRDLQRHPTTGRILHVDFQRIKFGEKIRVEVAVNVTGKPKGVKEQGGILEHTTRSVEIMCLPREIPESLDLDVSEMMIGDVIKIADLVEKYPEIDFQVESDTTVASVRPPVIEEEPEVEELEGEEAEPEVVSKEKKGEEEEEEKPEESGGSKGDQ
jgi:large subunit ribosomal protein L25